MGGYGALKLAFTKPEDYAACASLSGAVDLVYLQQMMKNGHNTATFEPDNLVDGGVIEGTDADLFHLIARQKADGGPLPKVFQSCGTEDMVYELNKQAKDKLIAAGADVTYEEHPGIHDWLYWDTHIQRALDWLPLKNDSVKEEA